MLEPGEGDWISQKLDVSGSTQKRTCRLAKEASYREEPAGRCQAFIFERRVLRLWSGGLAGVCKSWVRAPALCDFQKSLHLWSSVYAPVIWHWESGSRFLHIGQNDVCEKCSRKCYMLEYWDQNQQALERDAQAGNGKAWALFLDLSETGYGLVVLPLWTFSLALEWKGPSRWPVRQTRQSSLPSCDRDRQ